MKTAKILSSIEDAIKYLETVDLFSEKTHNIKNLEPKKYSDKYFQTFHEGNYKKTFIVASENRDYDIKLLDGSFFQFTSRGEDDIHYSFMHHIEHIMSLEEFFDEYATDDNYELIELNYEYYLSSDKDKVNPCPIRYDVAKSEYKEICHSYAHIHIGIENDIRIPIDKIISPLHFVDFVIKNIYKNEWEKAFIDNIKFQKIVFSLKNQSENIEEEFFSTDEKTLLHIT